MFTHLLTSTKIQQVKLKENVNNLFALFFAYLDKTFVLDLANTCQRSQNTEN